MTSSVTAPLERQFGQMPGLNQMSSTSSAGASVITLQFNLDLSLDIAEQEVQAAINAAGNLLPSDLPAPPIYAKVNPADAPILTLAITSKTLPLTAGRGSGRHAPRAEDLAARRRRPGQHQRRPAPGGARPGQPARAGRLRAQHRRSAHHHPQRQRQRAEGQLRRPGAAPTRSTPTTSSQTPSDYQSIVDRLQERRAGAAVGRRHGRRRRREHQARRAG